MSIFVSIVADREPGLASTVESLLAMARYPEELRVVICRRAVPDEPEPSWGDDPRIEVLEVGGNAELADGWARAEIGLRWRGEELYMEAGPRLRFARDWDARALGAFELCGSVRPIVSLRASPWLEGADEGVGAEPPSPTGELAADVWLAPGEIVHEAADEPAEEPSLARRALARGYELFASRETIAWQAPPTERSKVPTAVDTFLGLPVPSGGDAARALDRLGRHLSEVGSPIGRIVQVTPAPTGLTALAGLYCLARGVPFVCYADAAGELAGSAVFERLAIDVRLSTAEVDVLRGEGTTVLLCDGPSASAALLEVGDYLLAHGPAEPPDGFGPVDLDGPSTWRVWRRARRAVEPTSVPQHRRDGHPLNLLHDYFTRVEPDLFVLEMIGAAGPDVPYTHDRDDDLTVIVNGFARPEYLPLIWEAVQYQTRRPRQTWIVQNAPGDRADVPHGFFARLREAGHDDTLVFDAGLNLGPWFRFFLAAMHCRTRYVAVYDDDTLSGRLALATTLADLERRPGVYGGRGITFRPRPGGPLFWDHDVSGWDLGNEEPLEVDFVGHMWVMETAWLGELLRHFPDPFRHAADPGTECGEDMYLSYVAQKNGRPSFAMRHGMPVNPRWSSLRGAQMGRHPNAMSMSPALDRGDLYLSHFVANGWRLLHFADGGTS